MYINVRIKKMMPLAFQLVLWKIGNFVEYPQKSVVLEKWVLQLGRNATNATIKLILLNLGARMLNNLESILANYGVSFSPRPMKTWIWKPWG